MHAKLACLGDLRAGGEGTEVAEAARRSSVMVYVGGTGGTVAATCLVHVCLCFEGNTAGTVGAKKRR